jgi:hypothetical protein
MPPPKGNHPDTGGVWPTNRGVGLTGPEHVAVAAEDRFHQLRAGDVDHVQAERKAHGEHVAVGP